MKTRFLIIFAIVMIIPITESFAEEIKIKFGETVQYENLNLYFYDIEDSRCPLDVTCIWEGKVLAKIHTSNQTHKIGGGFEIGYPLTYITPYTIALIDVKPHPISTEKPDYVAILDISKPEKNIEVNYVDFRNASGEVICEGYSSGGGFFEYPECGPPDQFVIHLLMIILPIVGLVVGFVIWRKRK